MKDERRRIEMPSDPSDRLTQGILEGFFIFEVATASCQCNACHDLVDVGEKSYRPVGFFRSTGTSNAATARDLEIHETFCVDCAEKRRAFLAERLGLLVGEPNKEPEHGR